jgi:hypothetical protein
MTYEEAKEICKEIKMKFVAKELLWYSRLIAFYFESEEERTAFFAVHQPCQNVNFIVINPGGYWKEFDKELVPIKEWVVFESVSNHYICLNGTDIFIYPYAYFEELTLKGIANFKKEMSFTEEDLILPLKF